MLGVSNWPSVHLDKLFEQTPRRTQEIQLRCTHRQTILYTRNQRMHSAPNSLPYTRSPTMQWPVLECKPVIREAIVKKIPEFYEIISQTGGGGSIGFHISYSEMVITAKLVGKSE